MYKDQYESTVEAAKDLREQNYINTDTEKIKRLTEQQVRIDMKHTSVSLKLISQKRTGSECRAHETEPEQEIPEKERRNSFSQIHFTELIEDSQSK